MTKAPVALPSARCRSENASENSVEQILMWFVTMGLRVALGVVGN